MPIRVLKQLSDSGHGLYFARINALHQSYRGLVECDVLRHFNAQRQLIRRIGKNTTVLVDVIHTPGQYTSATLFEEDFTREWGILTGEYLEVVFTHVVTKEKSLFRTVVNREPIYPSRTIEDLAFECDGHDQASRWLTTRAQKIEGSMVKRCPKCHKTYADGGFSFCLEDGTPLSDSYDPDETLVLKPDLPS
jgi:hypothetical protein